MEDIHQLMHIFPRCTSYDVNLRKMCIARRGYPFVHSLGQY